MREWNQYSTYAFPNDDLLPITHNYTNDLFGWGATVVDAIDTAIVMGLTDIVEQQLKHIAAVDFTSVVSRVATNDPVQFTDLDQKIRSSGRLL